LPAYLGLDAATTARVATIGSLPGAGKEFGSGAGCAWNVTFTGIAVECFIEQCVSGSSTDDD
jgi:hypothetical protein